MSKEKQKKKAEQLATNLMPVAASVGVTFSDNDRRSPQLDTRSPVILDLGRQCGQILRSAPLFVHGRNVVTVNEDSGEQRSMTPTRFVSWVENYLSFGRHLGADKGELFSCQSISTDLATKIMASDSFIDSLRPLNGIHDVSLPTWADKEKTKVRLLPKGYDEETGIFTAPAFEYDTKMDEHAARVFFLETYKQFPFAEGGRLEENRSFGVQMSAHFAVFCRLMFLDCLRLGFVFTANQSGSGKTLLARLALAPVFGKVATEGLSRNEDERGKNLTTIVIEGRPYVVYDNVKGFLSSSELEGFLTTPIRTGRILGQSSTVTAPNLATILITGNQLTLSADLKRRLLSVELFCQDDATDREVASPMTEAWVSAPETRAKFLAASWALLNYWEQAKSPRAKKGVVPSFETFSSIVGGIVTAAKFADPLEPSETQMDETEQAWRMLLRGLADKVDSGSTYEYTPSECLDVARDELGVLDILTMNAKDERKSFGQRIRKWFGRRFKDNQGREFQFASRRTAPGMRYPVTVFAKKEDQ